VRSEIIVERAGRSHLLAKDEVGTVRAIRTIRFPVLLSVHVLMVFPAAWGLPVGNKLLVLETAYRFLFFFRKASSGRSSEPPTLDRCPFIWLRLWWERPGEAGPRYSVASNLPTELQLRILK